MARGRNNQVALIIGGLFVANLVIALRNRVETPATSSPTGSSFGRQSSYLLPDVTGRPVLEVPEGALSAFTHQGSRCSWELINPATGSGSSVAAFPFPCDGARVAWSPDRQRAIVSFPHAACLTREPDADEWYRYATAYLAEVDLRKGTIRRLPLPKGETRIAAFDRGGQIVAIVYVPPPKTPSPWLANEPTSLVVVLEGDSWQEKERISTSIPDDRWLSELAPDRSAARLLEMPAVVPIELSIDGEATGEWLELDGVVGTRAAVAREKDGEGAAGPLLFLDGTSVMRPERNVPSGAVASVLVRDNWILVAERGRGTRPRLYNALDATTAFASEEHWSTTLWPR